MVHHRRWHWLCVISLVYVDLSVGVDALRTSPTYPLPQAELLCSYHVGETVNSIHRTTLIPGGSEIVVYTTLSGTVGMLVPFTSREVCVYVEGHCTGSGPCFNDTADGDRSAHTCAHTHTLTRTCTCIGY